MVRICNIYYSISKYYTIHKPTVIHTGTTRARCGGDVVVMWYGLVEVCLGLPYLYQSYTGTTQIHIKPDT